MSIPFVKMHGLGNDFVVIDDLGKPTALCQPITSALAKRMCDRHFGIGADQLLWLKTPLDSRSDARMEILNPDGSTAEMCGNGIRAAALYLFNHGPKRKDSYSIETLGGLKHVELREGMMSVDMGAPVLGGGFGGPAVGEVISWAAVGGASAGSLSFFEVGMGNPHAVFFVDSLESPSMGRLEELGPVLEKHPRFPQRTNVEFVQVLGPHTIQVRVWERGAGLTLACGTGACASAVAALATGRVQPGPLEVKLPGGSLEIRWDRGNPVIMEGPAEEVFRGDFFV